MPKPKKGEIYGTFNNDQCYEIGLAKLRKISDIGVEPLDSHTIKITLNKKNDEVERAVNYAIQSCKGYVEQDLDNINALIPKDRKAKGDSGVLDTPFYG